MSHLVSEGPPTSAGTSSESPSIQRNILSGGPAVSADSGIHTMPTASRVTFNLEGLDPKDRDSLAKSVSPAEEAVPEVRGSKGLLRVRSDDYMLACVVGGFVCICRL